MKAYSVTVERELCGLQENFSVIAPDAITAADGVVRKLNSEPTKERAKARHLLIRIFETNEAIILK